MPFYRVTVDCWKTPPENVSHFPERVKRTVLIEAAGSDVAIALACDYCEATAEIGHKWTTFEFRSAARIELPIEIPTEGHK